MVGRKRCGLAWRDGLFIRKGLSNSTIYVYNKIINKIIKINSKHANRYFRQNKING